MEQPWIIRRNVGLFASANPGSTSDRTLDHWRFGPRAGWTHLPRTFDKPQCGWAVFEVFRPMACKLYTATIGTPQQTDEPWPAGQIEHKSVKMGRVGIFPGALPQRPHHKPGRPPPHTVADSRQAEGARLLLFIHNRRLDRFQLTIINRI